MPCVYNSHDVPLPFLKGREAGRAVDKLIPLVFRTTCSPICFAPRVENGHSMHDMGDYASSS
jgi:hypothetical protein